MGEATTARTYNQDHALGRAATISARALGRDSGETRFAKWM